MGEVINLKKRRVWRDLKARLASGKLFFPSLPVIRSNGPTSDAAIALAYALEGARQALWNDQR